MSLATINLPERETFVLTGCLDREFRISFIGLLRFILILFFRFEVFTLGKNFAGFFSNLSIKAPSLLILPKTCLSAEHETPTLIGQEAP